MRHRRTRSRTRQEASTANLSKANYKVEISAPAEADLDHVVDWYADRHPAGFARFFDAFETARQVLSTFAKAGRPREELRRGLRSYVVYPYVVFYTLHDKRVVVERSLHGHLDVGSSDFDADT